MVAMLHLLFVIFAVFGGLFLVKWKRLAWLHIPAFLWAVLIEFFGWVCPLTPLENWLLQRGNISPYHSGFVEHYIFPILYPSMLTRNLQIFLGLLVLMFNIIIYGWIIYRHRKNY